MAEKVAPLPAPSNVERQTVSVGFLPNLWSLLRSGNILGLPRDVTPLSRRKVARGR